MLMLRENGKYEMLGRTDEFFNPPAPEHCKRFARDTVNFLNNGGIKEYNKTILSCQAVNREIGWFPKKINEQTGKVFDWGPKPKPVPLASLYEIPEWAK